MKVIKNLKGGSFSKTQLIEIKGRKYVRKSIDSSINREYGLVRWHSQLRKIQILEKIVPDLIVPIERIGSEKGYYYYDMPYFCDGKNCFDYINKGNGVEFVEEKIIEILDQLSEYKYRATKGSMSVYLEEEVKKPLVMAYEILLQNKNKMFNSNEELYIYKKIEAGMKSVDDEIKKFRNKEINENLTHGNLTLENILIDPKSRKLYLIDPYYETYTENLNGDLSQLMQSAKSGYEYMVKRKKSSGKFSIDKYPHNEISKNLKKFANNILNKVNERKWYDKELLNCFYGSQFIRMFPFKLQQNTRLAYFFMLHGIEIIGEKINA